MFEVEFRPEKWEESADLIHVRSDHGHHLTIPVIAEPGKDVLEFPANIELCLNKQSNDSGSMESASVTVVERLKSFAPIPIDWTIEAVENSRADEFSIEPSQGNMITPHILCHDLTIQVRCRQMESKRSA